VIVFRAFKDDLKGEDGRPGQVRLEGGILKLDLNAEAFGYVIGLG